MNYAEMVARMIEASGNPLASMIVEDAHASVSRLGPLCKELGATKEEADKILQRLLSAFPGDAELNTIAADPNYVAALAALLIEAILYMVNKTVRS